MNITMRRWAEQGATVLRPGVWITDKSYTRGVLGSFVLPLPDHLARYLFVFLMSAIVRYAPARFEASADHYLTAVVDLAMDEARVMILLDSAFFISRVIIE
jgi:hypothetical protein